MIYIEYDTVLKNFKTLDEVWDDQEASDILYATLKEFEHKNILVKDGNQTIFHEYYRLSNGQGIDIIRTLMPNLTHDDDTIIKKMADFTGLDFAYNEYIDLMYMLDEYYGEDESTVACVVSSMKSDLAYLNAKTPEELADVQTDINDHNEVCDDPIEHPYGFFKQLDGLFIYEVESVEYNKINI